MQNMDGYRGQQSPTVSPLSRSTFAYQEGGPPQLEGHRDAQPQRLPPSTSLDRSENLSSNAFYVQAPNTQRHPEHGTYGTASGTFGPGGQTPSISDYSNLFPGQNLRSTSMQRSSSYPSSSQLPVSYTSYWRGSQVTTSDVNSTETSVSQADLATTTNSCRFHSRQDGQQTSQAGTFSPNLAAQHPPIDSPGSSEPSQYNYELGPPFTPPPFSGAVVDSTFHSTQRGHHTIWASAPVSEQSTYAFFGVSFH